MKLKASEIVLILVAVAIVALLGYNLMKSGGGEDSTARERKARTEGTSVNVATDSEFPSDPEALRTMMSTADREMTIRFMRMAIDRELPENYEFPEFLLSAGSSKESVKRIGERYPEFYEKGGNALIEAVQKYPVRYLSMIEESRAYRQLYRPTSEVEAEEQAAAAHKMREELAKQRAEEEAAAESDDD